MTSSARAPLPDGSAGPHAFVSDIEAPTLAEPDEDHLRRSLRLRDGDPLTVSDGNGRWRTCRFGTTPTPDGEVMEVAPPRPALTVGFALTKGAKPELAVQKLTEVGVDRIVLFLADRSVPRWDDAKAARNLTRLRRVAREAAMQSRRVWLPDVDGVQPFDDVIAGGSAVLADMGAPLLEAQTTVLVGPEGGWSERERGAAPAVALGPHVLRAETAAIAAGVLMAARRAR